MQEENLERLFKNLQGDFDVAEPEAGHKTRFSKKLNASDGLVRLEQKKNSWWKPLSIAASVAVLCTVVISLFITAPTIEEQVAEISPEVSQTEFYFASLVEEQVKQLESESTPETKKMIDDTMIQLKKLEASHNGLEQDLLSGGNSKLILSAMITNFQTRIDLLQDVMNKIESIKNLKSYNDEINQTAL